MWNSHNIRSNALAHARCIVKPELAATYCYFYLIALGLAPGKYGATNPHLSFWMIKANIQSARNKNPIQM